MRLRDNVLAAAVVQAATSHQLVRLSRGGPVVPPLAASLALALERLRRRRQRRAPGVEGHGRLTLTGPVLAAANRAATRPTEPLVQRAFDP